MCDMKRLTAACGLLTLLSLTVPAQQPEQSATTANQSAAAAVETDQEKLFKAIESGDTGEVIKILDAGADPNVIEEEQSALVAAVRFNRADIAEILLQRGASVDPEEAGEGSALQIAAMIGRTSLVKLLIAHRADVNHMDHDGNPPLLLAVMGAMFKNTPAWLVRSYLEIDDDEKIVKEIGNEHLESARLLIQAGAKVNGPATEDGMTALMWAAKAGDLEMTKLLLDSHADPNEYDGEGRTALKLAEEFDSKEELAERLSRRGSDERKQALMDWVHFTAPGRKAVAAMLRTAGARR